MNDFLGAAGSAGHALHRYCVYGITVWSDFHLALPQHAHGNLAAVELAGATETQLAAIVRGVDFQPGCDDSCQYAFLADGSTYVRWNGLGEFLVSFDGRRILCRRHEQASAESFQVYLLGQALSFALINHGFEPLHATTVVIGGKAAAFLGDSGFGKSTLAASFLEAGHSVLTDDLLIVQPFGAGFLAYPGPPRIKLFPDAAGRFLADGSEAVPMHSDADKLILPLSVEQRCSQPVPLGAIYSLNAPSDTTQNQHVLISTARPREGFLELVKNTFNQRLVHADRLRRQLRATTHLAGSMPVKRLCYPRALNRLPEVRAAIEADLRRDS